MNLMEMIEKRKNFLRNNLIDTSDIDYLNQFNSNVKFLANSDFFDLIKVFYMINMEVGFSDATQELDSFKDVMAKLLEDIKESENFMKLMDAFYDFLEKYEDKIEDISIKSFLAVKGASKILLLIKTVLKKLKAEFSEDEINSFLKWVCSVEHSNIIALAVSLKGVNEELKSVYNEADDLLIPDFLPEKITRRLQEDFINDVNNSYLKAMTKEFDKELNALSNYKAKKQTEINTLRKKQNKELRDLDLLEQDFIKGRLTLENVEKYKLTDEIRYLAIVELIKLRNMKFSETYRRVLEYRKNPTNKLEVLFDKFGRNFNKLTEGEQDFLAKTQKFDKISENLNFIMTSSLKFIKENDEAFVNILTLDIEDLMQVDSLYLRSKISKEFILSFGNSLDSLTIKMLVRNVSKLDAVKVNFLVLEEYDKELLLKLNSKLFDLIVLYGINLSDENLKHYEFLENSKLLNIIDKYIELGLVEQIQKLPNLINNYSEIILKRIVLMEQLGEDYLTDNMTLNQKVRSGKDFYLGDALLDQYISINYQTFIDEDILNILNTNENVEILDELPLEISFIENYKKSEQVYLIGGLYFSRLKVLRCLKTLIDYGLTDYKEMLFQCLIFNYPISLDVETVKMLKNMDENIIRKQLN